MRRDRIVWALVLAFGFCCAVGLAAGVVMTIVGPHITGVDV